MICLQSQKPSEFAMFFNKQLKECAKKTAEDVFKTMVEVIYCCSQ